MSRLISLRSCFDVLIYIIVEAPSSIIVTCLCRTVITSIHLLETNFILKVLLMKQMSFCFLSVIYPIPEEPTMDKVTLHFGKGTIQRSHLILLNIPSLSESFTSFL